MTDIRIEELVCDEISLRHLDELKQSIKAVTPFIGAGMSVSSGYPAWRNFLLAQLKKLSKDKDVFEAAKASINKLKKNQYLAVASDINSMLNNNLYELIREEFAPKRNNSIPDYVNTIQKFGCTTIMTTNYDSIIEDNLKIGKTQPDVVLPLSPFDIISKDKQQYPMVIKLHGTYNNADSIIITEDQYINNYVHNHKIKNIFKYLWASKVLLFIGCSLEKDYLVEYMAEIAQSDGNNYHYAILQTPENEKKKNQKELDLLRLKIRPIWYPTFSHEPLLQLLEYIASNETYSLESNASKISKNTRTITLREINNFSYESIDSIAFACKKEHRKKLFYTIINSNTTQKFKGTNIDTVKEKIIASTDLCVLRIQGEPGTGKSTILSLLFLEFTDCFFQGNLYPIYIDLHQFETFEREEVVSKFKEFTSKIELIGNGHNVILFIDGLDYYQRENGSLEQIFLEFISSIRSSITKIAYSIGTLPNNRATPPFKHKNLRLPQELEHPNQSIKLNQINTQSGLFYQTTEILLKINALLPASKYRSRTIDKLRNLTNIASGYYTDFRTINFLIQQYKKKNDILDDHVAEIYLDYYSELGEESLFEYAKNISLYTLGKQIRHIDQQSGKNVLYKSQSIRNFMFAYYYVHSIMRKEYQNLKLFDCILPPCVNGFAKNLINHSSKDCEQFINNAIESYKELSLKQQTQVIYLFGRVGYSKELVTSFLLSEYDESILNSQEKSNVNTNDLLMKYRTTGISLIYIGHHDIEDDFYAKLLYHPQLRRLNRLFHIEYYTNDTYKIGEDRDLNKVKCTKSQIERLCNALYNSILNEPEKGEHSYYLSIITLINLIVYDHYRSDDPLVLYKDSGIVKLLNKLVNEESITNQIIKSYIMSINTKWEKEIPNVISEKPVADENIYQTLVKLFYQLKKTTRAGWLKEERRIDLKEKPESVADHSWASCLLAMTLLSDDIKICSYMRGENLRDYNEYNKSHIIDLLLIHDLAESYTGDIIGKDDIKSKLEKEFTSKLKVYDSFPYFRSFRNISNLLDEYNSCTTINSRIAYDIDKLEPLIQLYIYYDLLDKPEKVLADWKNDINNELSTTLGRKIFEFITRYITN